MKKIMVIIMVAICCFGQTEAQVKFGIKGGLNFENFNFDSAKDDLTLDNAIGWQVGALLQFKVPVVGLGVQPELLYTVKKADVNDESSSIHYFEIPLNIRWEFNLIMIRPYVLGGPYFSYAVNFNGDDVFKSQLNRFDWGIGLGGGVEIWKLQLGLRYSWGLQNISSVSDFELKNNTFSLTLGFLF